MQTQPCTTKISLRPMGQTWPHTNGAKTNDNIKRIPCIDHCFRNPFFSLWYANWTEHPDFISRHAWLAVSSIWMMEQVRRRLQALPNVHSHHFQHCKFGGATRKPTRLMTVNMEKELAEELRKVERPRAPTRCLIGKTRMASGQLPKQQILKSIREQ